MVRYVALAALVVCLGGSVLMLAGTMVGDLSSRFQLIAAACGAIIFISLFIMKFIGPPPHSFVLRAALAFAMTAMALYVGVLQRGSISVMVFNVALGLALLTWYARE